MRDLGTPASQVDFSELEVMEPVMVINDDLKVIYINEAFEEALADPESAEKKLYQDAQAAHEGYGTRLHRLPITIEFMKEWAELSRDSYMIDLIARKEPQLRAEGELYEVSSFYAFKNLFFAKYPITRNIYKATKKMEAVKAARAAKNQ